MKRVFIFCSIALAACQQGKFSPPKHETLSIINYLKTTYKIDPQIRRFDSIYINELNAEHKSLNPDSLINSRIRQYTYKPLDLDFVEYNNRYDYKDRTDTDCYSIYLIRDNKTGAYYQDYVDAYACTIVEDYCTWSFMINIISKKDTTSNISPEDIKAYNSISSDRLFGENEFHFGDKRIGIQSYLNSVFKFSRPTKSQLDSLFYNYDKFLHVGRDTLLSSPTDLYTFLRIQAAKIRSEPNYGNLNRRLERLKSQVVLLLLQTSQASNNLFIWIYKNDSHLRIRRFGVFGNKKSTYSYRIEEYETCF